MQQPVLGFVGVGRMGSLMSARLLQRGYAVHVYDVSAEAVAAMTAQGAIAATSPAAVGDAAGIVFLSLPNPEFVRQAALNADGLSAGRRVKRVVDFSTIGPRTAGIVAQGCAERDIVCLGDHRDIRESCCDEYRLKRRRHSARHATGARAAGHAVGRAAERRYRQGQRMSVRSHRLRL